MAKAQRATAEIIKDILAGVDQQRPIGAGNQTVTVTKRELMRSANLNHQQLERYMERLEERGFVDVSDNGSYDVRLLEKGKEALDNSSPDHVARSLLQEADRRILDVLEEGRNTAANIGTETGYERQYVHTRLQWLVDHGYVANIGNGVFELANSRDEKSAGG